MLYLLKYNTFGKYFDNVEFTRYPFVALSSVMVRKKILELLDHWFDDELSLVEDFDLWIRIGFKGNYCYINELLTSWRVHKESMTFKRKNNFVKEINIVLDKYLSNIPNFINNYPQVYNNILFIKNKNGLFSKLTKTNKKIPHIPQINRYAWESQLKNTLKNKWTILLKI